MSTILLSVENWRAAKASLHSELPEVRSSHLAEAMAAMVGARTHAAVAGTLRGEHDRPPITYADAARFIERLKRLGYAGIALERFADALVVPHEVIEASPTISIAVANTLRSYAPELHPACGDDALALATADAPLLLVVEDVNLARDPAQILDRLLGWSAPGEKAGAGHSRWLLLCPVWRSNTGSDRSARRERVEANSLSIGSYSRHEAVHAINAAARARGLELTPVEAEELAHALDDDPLLIGLNRDWANPTPSNALRSYVEQGLTDAAKDDLPAELRLALDRLAAEALRSRDHSPPGRRCGHGSSRIRAFCPP